MRSNFFCRSSRDLDSTLSCLTNSKRRRQNTPHHQGRAAILARPTGAYLPIRQFFPPLPKTIIYNILFIINILQNNQKLARCLL
jgi:hypothetical protein